MCLSIGTPKIINFPFVPNGKLNIFRCPKFWAHYSLIVMCLNIGTLKNHHIPFGTNEKVVVLGVPKLKHFKVNKTKKLIQTIFFDMRRYCQISVFELRY